VAEKQMNHDPIDFRSYLAELFERPFKLVNTIPNTGSGVSYVYQISDCPSKAVKPGDCPERNDTLTVNFSYMNPQGNEWEIDFTRGGSTALTGEGQASRVFASVLDAIKRFTNNYEPETLTFSAAKYELRVSDWSYRSGSRVRLYKSMISKYAPRLGYSLAYSQEKGNKMDVFVLKRND
jgi:hypothetical protein